MGRWGDEREILRRSERTRARLWRGIEERRAGLAEIARHIYPAAEDALTLDAEALADDRDRRDQGRLTLAPIQAFGVCVNGFYSHLTPPNERWFNLGYPKFGAYGEDEEDAANGAYEALTDATRWLIGWCGAYREVHALYRSLVAFGFGCVVTSPDRERYVHAECLRPGQYALGVGADGKVDRLVRRYAMRPSDALEEFGPEAVGRRVARMAEEGDPGRPLTVWQLIEPHSAGKAGVWRLDAGRFGYRSVYWCGQCSDGDGGGLLAVRGSKRRPFVAPRIQCERGEAYGRGFGADVIGHCRGLQELCESAMDISDQEAHPAMMAPASMADDGLRLEAYAVNYYRDDLHPNAVYRAVQQGADPGLTERAAARLEGEIRRVMLNSEFETLDALRDAGAGGRMTATEVQARVSEKLEQLQGIATTLNDEWLDPFVTLMADYAMDPPEGLPPLAEPEGAPEPFEIRYESRIHRAANAATVNAGFDSLQRAGALAEGDPAVMDNFDADAIARDVHRRLGGPERWLRKAADRNRIREERARARGAEREAQMRQVEAKTLRDAAAARVDPEDDAGVAAMVDAALEDTE